MKLRSLAPILYILFLMLPIYWLVSMSLKRPMKSGSFSLFPQEFALENYAAIYDPRGIGAISTQLFT